MNTYLRLLSFAKPFGSFVPQYFLTAVLAVIFGLVNFTLLIPLLDILFGTSYVTTNPEQYKDLPAFNISLGYIKSLFYFYFYKIIALYGKIGALKFVCGVIITSVFLSNLFKYLSQRIIARVRSKVIYNLRKAAFERITMLHLGYFSNAKKGDLMSRLSNDVQEVENSVVSTLTVVFREPFAILGYFLLLFSISAKLTLFTLVLLPISGLLISEVAKRLKKDSIDGQNALSTILINIDEAVSGIRIIKAFNAQKFINNRFDQSNSFYAIILRSMYNKKDLASPLSEFLGVAVVIIILMYGGIMVLNNESELSASVFITYIVLFSQILVPAKAISNAFSNIQRGIASGERIIELIDTESAIKNNENGVKLNTFNSSIEFRNVSFKYENDLVLKNISFTINKGETLALVGTSGGGKSTIADLIPRFYDVFEGEILIDGINNKNYDKNTIRDKMGVVSQESILFNDTIFNNIVFGKENITELEVMNAAKVANAHDFIIETENGYQTEIGDRGTKLSGGQKQRLNIARAILRNPEILILDEATSALDSESEKLVQNAISNLLENRTAIIIAHRLSTIVNANQILVLNKGEIVERGTHSELMQLNGYYNKLYQMQSL
jgi:ATP-binding cassette, subfamily B, bacterial MsbA